MTVSGQPDWVVVGLPLGLFARYRPDERVMVVASTALSADLTGERLGPRTDGEPLDRAAPVDLTLRLSGYVVVAGTDYADALRRLFAKWNPEPAQAAVGAGPAGLPPGEEGNR